jgi:hypothetical protein
MNIEKLESELLSEIESVDRFLNKNELIWKQVRGALNILKNKNREHYPKIKRKLFMDFRMVTDHQISVLSLDPHMDQAYEIAEIFEREKA